MPDENPEAEGAVTVPAAAVASARPKQDDTPAITAEGVAKWFGGCCAVEKADLRVARGEIHAVIGENGAGKSTMMRMLAGVIRADSGRLVLLGHEGWPSSPSQAATRGVAMVHQHFMLVSRFTVLENLALGVPRIAEARDRAAVARQLMERFGLVVPLDDRVEDIGVGDQQRTEILKALGQEPQVLILDEPTAVLAPPEVEVLFATIRRLREAGLTVVLLTHKLDEVMDVCDTVTVMRRGRTVARRALAETTVAELARLMVGRDVALPGMMAGADSARPPSVATSGAETNPAETHTAAPRNPITPVLEVHDLQLHSGQRRILDGLSFVVGGGEILGVAGVEGNGQRELVQCVLGHRRANAGAVRLAGRDVSSLSVSQRLLAGIACIPEDRHHDGLVLGMSLRENLRLGRHRESSWRRATAGKRADAILTDYDVRPPRPETLARELSGGNQQKVVAARELQRSARLLIAAQPTRGVDLGAMEFLHDRIRERRDAGWGVLVLSADLNELLALSTRIVVMLRGRIVHEQRGPLWDVAAIGRAMVGATGSLAAHTTTTAEART